MGLTDAARRAVVAERLEAQHRAGHGDVERLGAAAIGIVTRSSRAASMAVGQPVRLVADHERHRAGEVDGVGSVPPRATAPTRAQPRTPRVARARPTRRLQRRPERGTRRRPRPARTSGCTGRRSPRQQSTAAAPAASAAQQRAGVAGVAHIDAAPAHEPTAPRQRVRPTVDRGRAATATTPCGVTVSATRQHAGGELRTRDAGAAWPGDDERGRRRPASTKTLSTRRAARRAPRRRASGPSMTNAPLRLARSVGAASRRRSRCTLGWRRPRSGRRRSGATASADASAADLAPSAANAAGSVTARSASTLRSTSTSASCRPVMNRL